MVTIHTQTQMLVANNHQELCNIIVDFLNHRKKNFNGNWIIGVQTDTLNTFYMEAKKSAQKPSQYIDVSQVDITQMKNHPKTNVVGYNYYVKFIKRS